MEILTNIVTYVLSKELVDFIFKRYFSISNVTNRVHRIFQNKPFKITTSLKSQSSPTTATRLQHPTKSRIIIIRQPRLVSQFSYTTRFAFTNEQRNEDYSPMTVGFLYDCAAKRIGKRRFRLRLFANPSTRVEEGHKNDSSELWPRLSRRPRRPCRGILASLRYGHRDIPLTRNARALVAWLNRAVTQQDAQGRLQYEKLRNRPRGGRSKRSRCSASCLPLQSACELHRYRAPSLDYFTRDRKLRAPRASLRFAIEKLGKKSANFVDRDVSFICGCWTDFPRDLLRIISLLSVHRSRSFARF